MNWVADQRRRGCTRLLPTVKLNGKSGKGNAISKGFSKLIGSLAIKPTIDPDLALTKELDRSVSRFFTCRHRHRSATPTQVIGRVASVP